MATPHLSSSREAPSCRSALLPSVDDGVLSDSPRIWPLAQRVNASAEVEHHYKEASNTSQTRLQVKRRKDPPPPTSFVQILTHTFHIINQVYCILGVGKG